MKTNVLLVEGGLGKHIMATAVAKAIKANKPMEKLVVMCHFVDPFMHLPFVDKVLHWNASMGFAEENIGPDINIMKYEPYIHTGYLTKQAHLIKAWCDGLGIVYSNEQPEINVLAQEENQIRAMFRDTKLDENKTVLFQWCGGMTNGNTLSDFERSQTPAQKRTLNPESALNIARYIKQQGFNVIIVKTDNQPNIGNDGEFPWTKGMNHRSLFALIKLSRTFVGVDSFVQHAAAALGKKGIVLWAGTDQKVLGYELHSNIEHDTCATPRCHRPYNALPDLMDNGQVWQCPYGESCTTFKESELPKIHEVIAA